MKTLSPFNLVIFGGDGDLSFRKLIPALYHAYVEGNLPNGSKIFLTCFSEETFKGFDERLTQSLNKLFQSTQHSEEKLIGFKQLLNPVELDITQNNEAWLNMMSRLKPEQPRLYYLAISPSLIEVTCSHLEAHGGFQGEARIIVEKPIGYDQKTASDINDTLAQYLDESSIYRIDHYLGKETVQNLMALRFSNVIFEHLWDNKTIDHVQITIAETVGLENRASFYDTAGALRDMVQNHLLQLLCLVAMESPAKLNARNIRSEKIKVLEALRPISEAEIDKLSVRGQYVAGQHDGDLVPGYLEELGMADSQTETFVALKAYVDNWRWANVPFYLRTGKRLHEKAATIVIHFKAVSHNVHEQSVGGIQPNQLVIRLQPKESIELTLMTKDLAQSGMQLNPLSLDLNLSDTYKGLSNDAYRRLILDAAAGDPTLFIHRDEVDAAWQWVDPIISAWQQQKVQPELYRAGSSGPSAAQALMQNDGRAWFEETVL